MMQLLPYEEGDKDLPRKQRLYWQLFIHERFAAIALGLPPVLMACGYPQPDVTLPTYIQTGFGSLCRLFSILDNDFMHYWTKYQGSSEKMGIMFWNPEPRHGEITASWIERKHQELDAHERSQHPNDIDILHSVEDDRDSYSGASNKTMDPHTLMAIGCFTHAPEQQPALNSPPGHVFDFSCTRRGHPAAGSCWSIGE
ncbi:hypothetical protein LRP88_00633 [Fusarium phalaenopsidis]